jgi:hypothetical protein
MSQNSFPQMSEKVQDEINRLSIGDDLKTLRQDVNVSDEDFIKFLREMMTPVRLSTKWVGNERMIDQRHQRRVAETLDADAEAIRTVTKLYDFSHPRWKRIKRIKSDAYNLWTRMSIDYPPEDGIRLIRRELIGEFVKNLDSLRAELQEAAVELNTQFEDIIAEGKLRRGVAFKREDYPDTLLGAFDIKYSFPSVECASEIRALNPQLWMKECAQLRENLDEALHRAETVYLEPTMKNPYPECRPTQNRTQNSTQSSTRNSPQNNPSRWIDESGDNDNGSSNSSGGDNEPADRFVPFRNAAEVLQDQRNALEADVLRIICNAFSLNLNQVRQATYQETGEYRLGIAGFQKIVYPPFPAKLTVAKPQRGKGVTFTLNRLLTNPIKFPLLAEFIKKRNLESTSRAVMLIGFHPRVKQYVAVTDILLEPDLLCFNVLIEEPIKEPTEQRRQHQLIFGEFDRILLAMRHQGLWSPYLD